MAYLEPDANRTEPPEVPRITSGADVIPGLAGLRKVRFALSGRGKRGGGRAVYYLILREEVALMIFAYSKSDQEDLTPEQKKSGKGAHRGVERWPIRKGPPGLPKR